MEFRPVSEFSSVEKAKYYYRTDDYQTVLKVLGPEIQAVIERNTCVIEEA